VDGEAAHQVIDGLLGVAAGPRGQVGVAGGGEDGVMTEELLDFQPIDTGLNQMGGIAVPIMPHAA
jgi:hypothetical protein